MGNPIFLRTCLATGFLSTLLCAGCLFTPRCEAADPFAPYADPVRIQAGRVVTAAGPGKETELSREVRLLRRKMHATGILSLNAVADQVYERAVREGWKQESAPSLRVVSDISSLSVSMWARLVVEDLSHVRFDALFRDFEHLAGSVRRFGPALLGYASWMTSFLSAAICWFAVWASIALFLRARPSLEADLARILRFPSADYLAAPTVLTIFLLPLFAGFGLAVVSCIWLALSAAYLRRTEILLMTMVILLLAILLFGGGVLHSLERITGEVPRRGWLGTEGYYPEAWPDASLISGNGEERSPISRLVRFSRGRAAMLAGEPGKSERIWTGLLNDGEQTAEILNNRGIVRAQQGRLREALADFEAALRRSPDAGPPLWNAYHVNLQLFDLERARTLQPRAWEQVQAMIPYNLRPAEMEQGEWIASPLQVGAIWKTLLSFRTDWIREAAESDLFRLYFRPLTPLESLAFLGLVWLVAGAWKALSLKVWVNRTCRGCGGNTLIVGNRETHEFCNPCRTRIGSSSADTDEPDRRGQGIGFHRLYVSACSMLVPGAGWFWAGKEVRAIGFGILLSLSLGFLSSSAGALSGGSIVSDLLQKVFLLSVVITAILWLAGSVSGIRSFRNMQQALGIGPRGNRR